MNPEFGSFDPSNKRQEEMPRAKTSQTLDSALEWLREYQGGTVTPQDKERLGNLRVGDRTEIHVNRSGRHVGIRVERDEEGYKMDVPE